MTEGLVLVGSDLKAKQEQEWLLHVHPEEVVAVVILAGWIAVIPVLQMVKVMGRFAFAGLAIALVYGPLLLELGTVLHFMFITLMVSLLLVVCATVVVTNKKILNGNEAIRPLVFSRSYQTKT